MHRKTSLLVLLFLLLSLPALPQGLRLSDSGWVVVKGNMMHWRDVTGELTIDRIREMQLDSLPPADAPNFGFDRAVHWFRFDVTNDSHEKDWMMEVNYAPLDHIDFYMASDSSLTWVHKICGDTLPISSRTLRHRHPVFTFSLEPGESKSIYLRVHTVSSVQLPVTFWHRRAFLNGIYNIQLVNGLFYGGMILMMLYQLFLFFSVRDKITFYYVCTLLTMINIVSYFQGYTFLYIFPQTPVLNDVFAMFSGPAFVTASTMLTRSFLNLPKFSRLLDRLMLLNMSLNVLAGILMFIFFRKISYQYHHYFILIHCMLSLISAGYCFYKKYRSARYYLMAWVTILTATSVFTMSNLGFVPGYMSTNYSGLMIGCILQMLFISFALGDRWNILEKENRRAKELELKRNQDENERLEKEVLLRTEEIQNKSERLEEVNRVKDKLFSVVSHDIKGPLSSLQLALSLLRAGDVSAKEFQQLSNSLEERFSHTTEFIENLLQWATLQLKGESYEPSQINLSDIADETVSLLSTEIKRKNITVRNNLHNYKLQAYADLNMVRSVLRNLFTNAIKFTGENGMITLSFLRTDRQVIVSVADTGVGIPASHRNRLFTLNSITTPGTSKEKGTGLGLLLCREFVEKNGGRIWFETTEGKGTTFFFSLPESDLAIRQSMANG